eukprot:jgi/Psemu1/282673/fgenesh1_pg.11_\
MSPNSCREASKSWLNSVTHSALLHNKTPPTGNPSSSSPHMDNTPPAYCDLVFTFADTTYRDLRTSNEWDRAIHPDVDNKSATETTEAPNTSSPRSSSNPNTTCWNCGKEGCDVFKCPESKDKACIQDNKKLYYYMSKGLKG